MFITFTFSGYLHDYDYVALTPIFISLWRLAPPSIPAVVCSTILIALLYVPQRLIHVMAVPVLEQWRTVLVVVMAGLVVDLSLSRSRGLGIHRVPNPIPG